MTLDSITVCNESFIDTTSLEVSIYKKYYFLTIWDIQEGLQFSSKKLTNKESNYFIYVHFIFF